MVDNTPISRQSLHQSSVLTTSLVAALAGIAPGGLTNHATNATNRER